MCPHARWARNRTHFPAGVQGPLKGPGGSRVEVLDREPRYFERGVKEASYTRAYQPSLNKDGGGGGGGGGATNFRKSMTR